METEAVVKRLALIKYLFSIGSEQAKKPEPVCWVAVLTFHDTVELFLQLVAEYFDIKKRLSNVTFMEYWSLINPQLKKRSKGELTQIISMERLNKARRDFKHYGHPPSKTVIVDDFRANVTNFLVENTKLVFDTSLDAVSLVELVECEEAKVKLTEAERFIQENKLEESLDNIALSFATLIDDYSYRKRDKWGRNPFYFGKSMTFHRSFFMHIDGDLGRFIDDTQESIEALQRAVQFLSLGLDYRRYTKFWHITPHVIDTLGGYRIQRKDRKETGLPTTNDVEFCINFVIESALTLQEFDYELTNTTKR